MLRWTISLLDNYWVPNKKKLYGNTLGGHVQKVVNTAGPGPANPVDLMTGSDGYHRTCFPSMSGRGLKRTVEEAADARRRRFLWQNLVLAIYAARRQLSDGPRADSEVADINENSTCSSARYVPRITCSYVQLVWVGAGRLTVGGALF